MPSIALPVSLRGQLLSGTRTFSPASLFSLSEPGVWFDPSDLTTLFQDPAGTTPVTAPGNTVGLMLDKSRGLALGAELDDGGLATLANWTVFGTNVVAQDGDAIKITFTTGQSPAGAYQQLRQTKGLTTDLTVGKWYKVTGQAKVNSGSANAQIATASNWTSAAITSTSFTDFTIYFLCDNANTNYIAANNLSTGEEIWFRALSVRELAGNHATQATITSRPTYSIEPVGGRRNLLTWSEDFRNTAAAGSARPWAYDGTVTITPNTHAAPDGTLTADTMTSSSGNQVTQELSVIQNTDYTNSLYYRKTTGATYQPGQYLQIYGGTAALYIVRLNTDTGVATPVTGSVPPGYLVTSHGDYWRLSITGNSGNNLYARLVMYPNMTASTAVAAGSQVIWGAQLELGSTATAYQRVTTQHDVTEAGVASVGYLYFDGSDDHMVTSTITPATDKAQIFIGVKKLSDANDRCLIDYGPGWAGTTGAFGIYAPSYITGGLPAPKYSLGLKGSTGIRSAEYATYTAPITNVLSTLFDISAAAASEAVTRINGAVATPLSANGDAGGGNFNNLALQIGRYGTQASFFGHLYSLITRFGPTLDAPTIASTETWVAGKTGFYTPIITGVPTIGVS